MNESYRIAVQEIGKVGANQDAAVARRDLAALKALIELLEGKLPPETQDYETDTEPTGTDISA